MKRGQVGLFFIIGLVIVVIVGIVYFLVVPSFIQEEDNSADIVKTYVESCVETSIHEGNYELGKSGGYYVPPLNSLGDVPYYLINKQKTIPSITKREKDLGGAAHFPKHWPREESRRGGHDADPAGRLAAANLGLLHRHR